RVDRLGLQRPKVTPAEAVDEVVLQRRVQPVEAVVPHSKVSGRRVSGRSDTSVKVRSDDAAELVEHSTEALAAIDEPVDVLVDVRVDGAERPGAVLADRTALHAEALIPGQGASVDPLDRLAVFLQHGEDLEVQLLVRRLDDELVGEATVAL